MPPHDEADYFKRVQAILQTLEYVLGGRTVSYAQLLYIHHLAKMGVELGVYPDYKTALERILGTYIYHVQN